MRLSAAALALWAGPVRSRIDALADLLGGYWDRALDWGASRVGLSWRA